MAALPTARVARMRLASQRLTPGTATADPVEAARAVVGIQAQDLRAMGLALRSRVAGPGPLNVLMPWAAAMGVVLGLPDGRFRAADPPPPVHEDEALATLAHRYLAGYGPAGAADLAKWSGLPGSMAKRALTAAGELERAGELLAIPGSLDADPPLPPPTLLLAPFDTSMLGWRTREPLVRARVDGHILPGGGIIRAAVLARGRAVATWRVEGGGKRRRLVLDRFGVAPPNAALRAEIADVARFLGIHLDAAA